MIYAITHTHGCYFAHGVNKDEAIGRVKRAYPDTEIRNVSAVKDMAEKMASRMEKRPELANELAERLSSDEIVE